LPSFKLPIVGTIVWANRPDQNNRNHRDHPMIVLEPPKSDDPDAEMIVVVISGSLTEEKKDTCCVRMRSGPTAHLKKECWAVCDWVLSIRVDEIIASRGRGFVANAEMREIYIVMDELAGNNP